MGSFSADIRRMARPVVHGLREVPYWVALAGQGGAGQDGPRVMFLPARGTDDGAAALRIYGIAGGLEVLGWRSLVVSWRLSLPQRRRLMSRFRPDVIVMQSARHALNHPDLYPGVPVVYDMDDADFHLAHLAAPVRAAMPRVAAVIAGSDYVARWCRKAGAGQASVVWTGAAQSGLAPLPQADRAPVVVWAQTRPMDYVREAGFVRSVMSGVAQSCPGVTLQLQDRRPGDDPGFAQTFAVPGLTVDWRKKARYRDYLVDIGQAAIGLAPLSQDSPFSRGKSFGKVLGYLDRGTVVVGSDTGEHSAFFSENTGVISNSPKVWVAAILRLLGDPDARQTMANAAHTAFVQRLSAAEAARRVDTVLRGVISRDPVVKVA